MIGQRIRELRKSKKLTQTQFGEILNVGKSTVSQWETGVNEPDAKTIDTIADEFGVSIDYIYGRPSKSSQEEITDSQIDSDTDFATLNEWLRQIEDGRLRKENGERYDEDTIALLKAVVKNAMKQQK